MKKINFYNVENRPWTGPRLYTGAIVGHTTSDSVKVWVRSRLEGDFHFLLTKAPLSEEDLSVGSEPVPLSLHSLGAKIVAFKSADLSNRTDRTSVFEFNSLESGTRYYYYVIADDVTRDDRVIVGQQTVHSFKTISSDNSNLCFGLYSCHDPYKNNSGDYIWKHFYDVLEEKGADFLIGGGDQVYIDMTKTDIWKWLKKIKNDLLNKCSTSEVKEAMLSWYQDVYRGYWGFPNVKKVHRSFPNYMIWDDHEIMDGWGSRDRDELSDELDTWHEWENKKKNLALADKMFVAAKEVYTQYQHSHNPTTKAGVFDYSINQKHAEFFVMDMRGQREFDLDRLAKRDGKGAKDRILGKDQLERFKSWLTGISADTKVIYIVSPVPVVHWSDFAVNSFDVLSAKDDFRDEWDHETNHDERDKILELLAKHSEEKKTPVIFLSGDVHMSAVFKLTNSKFRKARLFQVTSSPISRPPAEAITGVILSNKGKMKTKGKYNGYNYERLAKFRSRNFCLLKSQLSDTGCLSLNVDFYGETDDDDEIKMKRVKLI
jgi:alkaline phosphatase D